MSAHKRKRCWFCAQDGIRRSFKNRVQMRNHILQVHPDTAKDQLAKILFSYKHERGKPNAVHYGARMRKKLGLEYNRAGHLRSTLEPVEREAT